MSTEDIEIQTDSNAILQQVDSNNSEVFVYDQNSREMHTHCHRARVEEVDVTARNKLHLACGMYFFLIILEFTGGILSNSLSVVMDSVHLCTDLISCLIALLAIWIAERPATQRFNFGWHRAEIIGAIFAICFIWFMTGGLCYLTVKRILLGSFDINPVLMMITAGIAASFNFILGLLLYIDFKKWNVWLYLRKANILKPYMHSKFLRRYFNNSVPRASIKNCWPPYKNEGIQTTCSLQKETKNCSLPIKTAIINALGDMLQNVVIFFAGLTIYYQPTWLIIDAILTFAFALIVLIATLLVISHAVMVLMESTPTYLDYNEVKQIFESIQGVKSVHNLRIWALNLDKVACLVHLEIDENVKPMDILKQANHTIHQHYHFFETTIQIE